MAQRQSPRLNRWLTGSPQGALREGPDLTSGADRPRGGNEVRRRPLRGDEFSSFVAAVAERERPWGGVRDYGWILRTRNPGEYKLTERLASWQSSPIPQPNTVAGCLRSP
jgi:hypothetical protein